MLKRPFSTQCLCPDQPRSGLAPMAKNVLQTCPSVALVRTGSLEPFSSPLRRSSFATSDLGTLLNTVLRFFLPYASFGNPFSCLSGDGNHGSKFLKKRFFSFFFSKRWRAIWSLVAFHESSAVTRPEVDYLVTGPVRVSFYENPAWSSPRNNGSLDRKANTTAQNPLMTNHWVDHATRSFFRRILIAWTTKSPETKWHSRASESLRRTIFQRNRGVVNTNLLERSGDSTRWRKAQLY